MRLDPWPGNRERYDDPSPISPVSHPLPRYPHPMAGVSQSVGSRRGWRARGLIVLVLAGAVLFVRGAADAIPMTPDEVAQEAEATFRSAMEAWAYEAFWRLWDMGSAASRGAISQSDFTDRMRAGTTRPAAGKQVEAIHVTPRSPELAEVDVRFGLEDKRRPWAESTARPFLLRFEDGRWTVDLWDFLGLAYYFPPDYLPEPPLVVPPPRPPRPKGPLR